MIWSSFNDTFLYRYFCILFGFSKEFWWTHSFWSFQQDVVTLIIFVFCAVPCRAIAACCSCFSFFFLFGPRFLHFVVTCVLIGTSSINFNLCAMRPKGLLSKKDYIHSHRNKTKTKSSRCANHTFQHWYSFPSVVSTPRMSSHCFPHMEIAIPSDV